MPDGNARPEVPPDWFTYASRLLKTPPGNAVSIEDHLIDIRLPLGAVEARLLSYVPPAGTVERMALLRAALPDGEIRVAVPLEVLEIVLARNGVGEAVESLGAGTLGLVLEHVLSAPLAALEKAGNLDKIVVETVELFPGSAHRELSFSLVLEDRAPLPVFVSGADAALGALIRLIEAQAPEIGAAGRRKVMTDVRLISPPMCLDRCEAERLKPGDVIALDARHAVDRQADLCLEGGYRAALIDDDGTLVLATGPTVPAEPDPPTESGDDLRLHLEFERMTLPLDDLRDLGHGTPAPVVPRDRGTVRVFLGNTRFASGDLVTVAGRTGVRLTAID